MRVATVSAPALLAVFARAGATCVDLQGIVPDGGEGALDLSFLLQPESLGHPLAPLDIFNNSFIGTVSGDRWATLVNCTVHTELSLLS